MRVYISEKALKQKPEDCTVCPICDYYVGGFEERLV